MELWQIIMAIAALMIAFVIFNYVNKTRKKTGPILSQAYLSLSEDERQYFDKDAEYERLTILYGLIGCFFVCVSITILTFNKIFAYIGIGFIVVAIIYSIVKLIELRSKKK